MFKVKKKSNILKKIKMEKCSKIEEMKKKTEKRGRKWKNRKTLKTGKPRKNLPEKFSRKRKNPNWARPMPRNVRAETIRTRPRAEYRICRYCWVVLDYLSLLGLIKPAMLASSILLPKIYPQAQLYSPTKGTWVGNEPKIHQINNFLLSRVDQSTTFPIVIACTRTCIIRVLRYLRAYSSMLDQTTDVSL
jgi:hypothetical protein